MDLPAYTLVNFNERLNHHGKLKQPKIAAVVDADRIVPEKETPLITFPVHLECRQMGKTAERSDRQKIRWNGAQKNVMKATFAQSRWTIAKVV